MRNGRLWAAVGFALLAAAAGALSLGLEAPAMGAVAAVAGVMAAAVASTGFSAAPERPDESPRADGEPPRADGESPRADGEPPPGETRPDAGPTQRDDTGDVSGEDVSGEDVSGEESPAPLRAPEPAPASDTGTVGATAPNAPAAPAPVAAPAAGAELVDALTGMLDHRYFTVALERRVAASRRKLAPFSLVIVQLSPEDPRRHRVGEQSMKVLAAVVRAVLREADTGCRIDDHSFGILLEDTPEAGAVWATERVRAGFFATTFRGNVKLAAGVAAYPAHSLEADRLLAAARAAVARSRRAGEESIEIARPDDANERAEGQG